MRRVIEYIAGIFDNLICRNPPRFWKKSEWKLMSTKERVWITWKHHMNLKSSGSGEFDQITTPVKEIILYGSVIFLAAEKMGIPPAVVFPGVIGLWILNWLFQWALGNYLDKKDMLALSAEIGNRRNKVFRELRRGKE